MQLQLLQLQQLDSAIDQLVHQLATIPEAAQLSQLQAELQQVEDHVRDLQVSTSDISSDLARAEAEVAQVRDRRTRNQAKIDSGAVTDPKTLQGLIGELKTLARRIDELEDHELEIMQQLEDEQNRLEAQREKATELAESVEQVSQAVRVTQTSLEEQLQQHKAERERSALAIDANLLSMYERLRSKKSGVGAAPIVRRSCGGCQLTLTAAAVAQMAAAPADELLRCEECSRILVRTEDSGL